MNDKQAALVGGPGVLTIPSVDKEGNPITHTFLVSKPSAQDLVTMQKWVMAQKLPAVREGISSEELAGLNPADRAILLREFAKAKNGKRQPTEAEVFQIVYSPDGIAMQVWLAARRNMAGLRLEAIRPLITEDNCDQVAADLDEASNGAMVLNDEAEAIDPKKPHGPT